MDDTNDHLFARIEALHEDVRETIRLVREQAITSARVESELSAAKAQLYIHGQRLDTAEQARVREEGAREGEGRSRRAIVEAIKLAGAIGGGGGLLAAIQHMMSGGG